MRKLYIKIVLAIWAVMILSSVAAVVVSSAIAPTEGSPFPRDFRPESVLQLLVDSAVLGASGSDVSDLVASVESTFKNRPILSYVLQNEAGTDLLRGGPATAEQVLDTQPADEHHFPLTHAGKDYSLRIIPGNHRGGMEGGHRVLERSVIFLMFRTGYSWLVVAIAAILSVGMSIAIARYLVRPLSSFESAGRRLAAGDFSARIASDVEHRGDEIAEFASTFDQMAGKIQTLVHSHQELLRDVSHEFRSPLARAHAALSLARQRTDGAVDLELDRVELEFDRLNGLIQKLLTFARLEATGVSSNAESLDLNRLLRDVVSDCIVEANSDDKSVRLNEQIEVNIDGVPELLSSCFENLVRNGLRHTAKNTSVVITVFEPEDSADQCQIDIRDFGPGVPTADLKRIFEPFYKIDNSANGSVDRSGIGLAIVEKAVVAHRGSVTAWNADDGGLIVSIRLPKRN